MSAPPSPAPPFPAAPSPAAPSPAERRRPLRTAPNPAGTADALVILTAQPRPGLRIIVRYVPGRWTVTAASVAEYLDTLAATPGWTDAGPEALSAAILDDIANEAVPRWAEVWAETDTPLPHGALSTDRQPGWDNPALLSRLAPMGGTASLG